MGGGDARHQFSPDSAGLMAGSGSSGSTCRSPRRMAECADLDIFPSGRIAPATSGIGVSWPTREGRCAIARRAGVSDRRQKQSILAAPDYIQPSKRSCSSGSAQQAQRRLSRTIANVPLRQPDRAFVLPSCEDQKHLTNSADRRQAAYPARDSHAYRTENRSLSAVRSCPLTPTEILK